MVLSDIVKYSKDDLERNKWIILWYIWQNLSGMVSCWGTRLESRLESKIQGSFIPDSSFLQHRQLFYKWSCDPHGLKTNWFQISGHLEDAKVQTWRPNVNSQSLQFCDFFSRLFGRGVKILEPFYHQIWIHLVAEL